METQKFSTKGFIWGCRLNNPSHSMQWMKSALHGLNWRNNNLQLIEYQDDRLHESTCSLVWEWPYSHPSVAVFPGSPCQMTDPGPSWSQSWSGVCREVLWPPSGQGRQIKKKNSDIWKLNLHIQCWFLQSITSPTHTHHQSEDGCSHCRDFKKYPGAVI